MAATEDNVYVYTVLFTDQTTYELRHFTRNDGELALTGSVEVASQIYDIVLDGDVVFLATADGLTLV